MNIFLVNDLKKPAESAFEVLERKGRGHPDTLSDRLAEKLSCSYSELTRQQTGTILRHQFDKLTLMGGKCDVRFAGGHFVSPVRLLINGRASPKLGDKIVHFRDLLYETASTFLEAELRNFDFLSNCRVILETTSNSTRGMLDVQHQGTSPVHFRFKPRTLEDLPEYTRPLANDTALGCAWAPYSPLELVVLGIEKSLTSDEARIEHPWLGSDVKIMASRIVDQVRLTVSIPQVSTAVSSIAEYNGNSQKILSIIERNIEEHSDFHDVHVTLNPGDDPTQELVYLRYTGSCVESGDEGQVGRGNRIGGVISARRPFSIEGINGKNSAYHAGKLYSVAAWDLANRIWETYKTPCEVFIISQIDRPLDDPWTVIVNSEQPLPQKEIDDIAMKILTNPRNLTNNILDGKYPLT